MSLNHFLFISSLLLLSSVQSDSHNVRSGHAMTTTLLKRGLNSGDGTYYTPGLGKCGQTSGSQALVAALSHADYSDSLCGKCINVQGPKGSVIVTVLDLCEGCKQGDVDLGQAAFPYIADLSAGRVKVTWNIVDCSGSSPTTPAPSSAASPASVPSSSTAPAPAPAPVVAPGVPGPATTFSPSDNSTNSTILGSTLANSTNLTYTSNYTTSNGTQFAAIGLNVASSMSTCSFLLILSTIASSALFY